VRNGHYGSGNEHCFAVGHVLHGACKLSHFGVTKAEGAILYFYGVGPSDITRLK
jgi:hypothetical protein